MITPSPLYPGARVALVCPSSALPADTLAPAADFVRGLGLEPVLYPSCYFESRHGYLAADDAQRAKDIQDAFADRSISGVLCARGGYGAHRLLPLLDLEAIARTPKYFSGYSDVTALLTAFHQHCGFVTWHTTMPSTEYKNLDDYTMGYLRRALLGPVAGPLKNPADQPLKALVSGKACGVLCGGNLSLLAASLGTPWEIDSKNKILFLEDIGEKTYRVDAMLTQLRNAGKFRDCAGVLLGAWTDCVPEHADRTLSLDEIFNELIVSAGKPVLSGLACGHILPTMSLPIGAALAMDADREILEVLS